jgi:ribonucleotide monophosphatase NagD (HAD superfamily)
MAKIAFLSRLQNERDRFELLLNQAGFLRRMTMKGVNGGLTIKDLLADILTRGQFIADRLDEIRHGESYAPCVSHSALDEFQEKYGFPDYESPLYEKTKKDHLVLYRHKNVALDEIISQEIAAYTNIVAALGKLSEGQCRDHDLYHRVAEHTFRPYRRAEASIRGWLKQIASEPKSP